MQKTSRLLEKVLVAMSQSILALQCQLRRRMQDYVTLSLTETELVSATTQREQDMLYIMRILESMGLQKQIYDAACR